MEPSSERSESAWWWSQWSPRGGWKPARATPRTPKQRAAVATTGRPAPLPIGFEIHHDSSKGSAATDPCWWEMLEKERAEQKEAGSKGEVMQFSLNYTIIWILDICISVWTPGHLKAEVLMPWKSEARCRMFSGYLFSDFPEGCLTQVGAIASIFMGGVACRTQMTQMAQMSLTSMWKCWPS